MTTFESAPEVKISDYSNRSDDDDSSLDIDDETLASYGKKHVEIARGVFKIVLEDWMHGYGSIYTQKHYTLLFERILDLISKNQVINFLLPGFPVKSPNNISKVLGPNADFAEFLALRTFIQTIRQIEGLYSIGACVTIMSDYHIFDEFIGTTEEAYTCYHHDLKEMVYNTGADDVIKIINLTSFPAFRDTIITDIGLKLKKDYGNSEFLEKFNENIKEDSVLLEKYKQMLKFMQKDQETNIPGSPSSRRGRKFLKEVTTGMMSQGIALDTFLKEQEILNDYVRVSIHHHHPESGKFPLDLFKQNSLKVDDVLRTPWHHTVLFDARKGEYHIAHKEYLLEGNNCDDRYRIYTVTHRGGSWLLIKIYFSECVILNVSDIKFDIQMIKDGCGVVITNQSVNIDVRADVIESTSLRSIIKEFGVVVLRGFSSFSSEIELFDYYNAYSENGIIPWKFGSLHKVTPNKSMPGIVNETGDLPIHWDMIMPPRYMEISQSLYKYEDFTCKEFLLYCKRNTSGVQGPTTLVDSFGATLALNGKVKETWKQLKLVYEICLTKQNKTGLYFGGKGNTYEYPLVQTCPWTHRDVLRWCQLWTSEQHPGTSQVQYYTVKSSNDTVLTIDPNEIEEEIKKIAFDKRFFFCHNYKEGDMVHINNYTMLHGRQGFQNERELWRLQLIPPSDNVPDYYKKYGDTFYCGDH